MEEIRQFTGFSPAKVGMKGRYESIPEVLAGLKKRGLLGDQGSVITAMDRLGIHCPLDDADLSALLDFLSPGNLKRDHRRARLARQGLGQQ
jgi:hypothetical protein